MRSSDTVRRAPLSPHLSLSANSSLLPVIHLVKSTVCPLLPSLIPLTSSPCLRILPFTIQFMSGTGSPYTGHPSSTNSPSLAVTFFFQVVSFRASGTENLNFFTKKSSWSYRELRLRKFSTLRQLDFERYIWNWNWNIFSLISLIAFLLVDTRIGRSSLKQYDDFRRRIYANV